MILTAAMMAAADANAGHVISRRYTVSHDGDNFVKYQMALAAVCHSLIIVQAPDQIAGQQKLLKHET